MGKTITAEGKKKDGSDWKKYKITTKANFGNGEKELNFTAWNSLLESKDKNNQYIITQQGLQTESFKDMAEGLKKDVRRANNKTFMYKVGMFLGVISTSYLLLVR
jgi:major membrane immunogen (membrane-anchored lipoprotein)